MLIIHKLEFMVLNKNMFLGAAYAAPILFSFSLPECYARPIYIYSGGQKLRDDFNMAPVSYFSILAIFSIFWQIQNKRVKINH